MALEGRMRAQGVRRVQEALPPAPAVPEVRLQGGAAAQEALEVLRTPEVREVPRAQEEREALVALRAPEAPEALEVPRAPEVREALVAPQAPEAPEALE